RLHKGTVCEKLRVAIHAGRGRREAGEGRGLDRRMAVPAINTVVARVVLVRKLHRLPARDVCPCVVRRTLDFGERPGDAGQNEDRAKDGYPGDSVRAAMKNLGHCRSQIARVRGERVIDLRTLVRTGAPYCASEVSPRVLPGKS